MEDCFVPLTVGGGITNIDQIQRLLRAGADKISINTGAYANPTLVDEAAKRYGAQCVVASIDARRREDGSYRCFSYSGTVATDHQPDAWARELESRGAGEILITSINCDGTMQGYDLALIEQVVRAVNLPVIASGGAGNYEHMRQAIQEAGASAVAAASMFHFTTKPRPRQKWCLQRPGIPAHATFTGIATDRWL